MGCNVWGMPSDQKSAADFVRDLQQRLPMGTPVSGSSVSDLPTLSRLLSQEGLPRGTFVLVDGTAVDVADPCDLEEGVLARADVVASRSLLWALVRSGNSESNWTLVALPPASA